MYIKKIHILIEQGLQNIGVFAYADMLTEEVDLQINKKVIKFLDDEFEPLKKNKISFEQGQAVLDRFQNLHVKDTILSIILEGDHYKAPLPDDYLHLISDSSQVLVIDNLSQIIPGNIIAGQYYYVYGNKSIVYNGNTYTTGQFFKGVAGLTGYTYSGSGLLQLVRLKSFKVPNRLQYEEFLEQVLTNYLTGTIYKSPVSVESANNLYVYIKNFFIYNFFITYVRKPKLTNFNFTTYQTSDNLVIGQKYESVDNQVTYNGNIYQPFNPFIIVSGHLNYSGTAKVRIYQDGDLELTDSMCYNIIDAVVTEISIIIEANQQKIVNLTQKDN